MGRSFARYDRVSFSRNSWRCLAATLVVLTTGYGTGAHAPALHSRTKSIHASDDPQDQPLPGAEGVVIAYLAARGWVNDFDPPGIESPEAQQEITGAAGVCIVLRQSGRIVGVGLDHVGDERMLRRAVGRALGQVLSDHAVARLPKDLRDEIGLSLTLEMDVAGPFIPLPGRTFDQIASRLEPGMDGIAIRKGETWDIRFPAQLMAMNNARNITGLLRGMAARLGFPRRTLREIRQQETITIYRFRTIRLAQLTPQGFPFQTHRSDDLVTRPDITPHRIIDLADGIADHLYSRLWPQEWPGDAGEAYRKPPGLKGDYNPIADDYKPLVAPIMEQALAAFALLEYAETRKADQSRSEQARQVAHRILLDLALLDETNREGLNDPIACAALIYAFCDMTDDELVPALATLRDDAIRRILDCLQPQGEFRMTLTDGGNRHIPPHGQAMLAGALSRAWARELDPSLEKQSVRQAIDAAWQSIPVPQQVTLLPWIGWAESDYALGSGGNLTNQTRLLTLRQAVEASRIDGSDASVPLDLDGGFSVSGRLSGTTPRATSQSLRLAVWIAGILPDSRLVMPAELASVREGHLHTIRFLLQLTARSTSSWRYRSPQRTFGGVRQALWDTDMPLAAQILGLLTASETISSLEKLTPFQNQ